MFPVGILAGQADKLRKPSATAPCRVNRLAVTYKQGHVATVKRTARSGKVRYGCSSPAAV